MFSLLSKRFTLPRPKSVSGLVNKALFAQRFSSNEASTSAEEKLDKSGVEIRKFDDDQQTINSAEKSRENFKTEFAKVANYWDQYVEEYYEEAEEEVEEIDWEERQRLKDEKRREREERDLLRRPITELGPELIVEQLRQHRAKDIVCIEVPPDEGPNAFVIICSPFNRKHGQALEIVVRRFIKQNFYYPKKMMPQKVETGKSGWYAVDAHNLILHIQEQRIRERYDLEMLYGLGEDPDNQNIHEQMLEIDDEFRVAKH